MNNDINEEKKLILKEQNFPYIDMSIDERDFCIKILSLCKDINDSNYKVDNNGKCEIVQMYFKKQGNVINANGALVLSSSSYSEKRWIDAYIYTEKEKIVVDMKVERLGIKDKNRVYTVLDEFELKNDKLQRKSCYTYDMKNIYDTVEDEYVKGRLK